MNRPYVGIARINKEVELSTEANSPEEAESIFESLLEDGEEGTVVTEEHEILEVLPADEGGMGELVLEK